MSDYRIKKFPKGHALYPDGKVFHTVGGVTTEYTLEQWQEQQQSQQ